MDQPVPRRIAPKIGKNALGCFVAAAVVFLILSSLCLIAVAKTGLVHIPLFSRLYHGPTPTRLIQTKPMTYDAFRVLLGGRFFAQAAIKPEPPYRVKLSEEELTAVVMTTIENALRNQEWNAVFSQIVIRPTDVEFFGRFEHAPYTLDLIAHFVPHVENGGVWFEPISIQIGDYSLPASVAYRVAGYVFSRDLGTWIIKFGEATVYRLGLLDGWAEIVAKP